MSHPHGVEVLQEISVSCKLSPNTTYTVNAEYAFDTNGLETRSLTWTFTTETSSQGPPKAPTGFDCDAQSTGSIRCDWNPSSGAKRYESGPNLIDVGTATSYTEFGLGTNTQYTRSVKACNSAGCSVASNTDTLYTLIGVPGSPQFGMFSEISG